MSNFNHYNPLSHKLKYRWNNQFEKVHSFITNVKNDLCLWHFLDIINIWRRQRRRKFSFIATCWNRAESEKNFFVKLMFIVYGMKKQSSMSSFLKWTVFACFLFVCTLCSSFIFYESKCAELWKNENQKKVHHFIHSHNWAAQLMSEWTEQKK